MAAAQRVAAAHRTAEWQHALEMLAELRRGTGASLQRLAAVLALVQSAQHRPELAHALLQERLADVTVAVLVAPLPGALLSVADSDEGDRRLVREHLQRKVAVVVALGRLAAQMDDIDSRYLAAIVEVCMYVCISTTRDMYVFVGVNNKRCVIEEQPRETTRREGKGEGRKQR